jgi:hypothetical protein
VIDCTGTLSRLQIKVTEISVDSPRERQPVNLEARSEMGKKTRDRDRRTKPGSNRPGADDVAQRIPIAIEGDPHPSVPSHQLFGGPYDRCGLGLIKPGTVYRSQSQGRSSERTK